VVSQFRLCARSPGRGDLWLQNETNVILHLKTKREGLILSLGDSAVAISMTR